MTSMRSPLLLSVALLMLTLSCLTPLTAACDKLWNDVCLTYAASDDVYWGNNCDFTSTDIGSARGGGDKCGALCKATSGCKRWSWTSSNGGTCYFKGAAPWTLVAKQGVACGFRRSTK